MKNFILFSVIISLFACTEAPKSTSDTTVTDSTMTRSMAENIASDSLVIVVDSTGMITFGGTIETLDVLETKLTDSLQSIKKHYGKMPDTIICKTKGTVLMGMRGAIHDVISETKEKVEKQ